MTVCYSLAVRFLTDGRVSQIFGCVAALLFPNSQESCPGCAEQLSCRVRGLGAPGSAAQRATRHVLGHKSWNSPGPLRDLYDASTRTVARHGGAQRLRLLSEGEHMENSIAANRQVWDHDYPWPRDGDEWNEFADYCGQPYERWYASVLDSLIRPFLRPGDTALEIAPGYGRWLGELSTRASHVVAVDLSSSCIDRCKERYSERDNVRYFVNDGKTLTGIEDASVNFAFSFEAFVHMEIDVN